VTATANEPRNAKAGMGIHHKCIYTSSCKHLLYAEHHNYRVRSTVHNVHAWGTVLVHEQLTFPVASLYKGSFYSIGTHWMSGENQQVTECVHCGAQIN
jgi:hypothetical protein